MASNDTAESHFLTLYSYSWYWFLCLLGALVLAFRPLPFKSSFNGRFRRPPGPKGIPVLGNMLEIMSSKVPPWIMYHNWSKQYGDMVYTEILGQRFLVLHSVKAVSDLLDQRGSIYADRVISITISMIRLGWAFSVMNYGPWWRAHRRMFHQYYNKTQISAYLPIIEHQTSLFLRRLVENPKNFMEDTKYLFGAIIIQISYGLTADADIRTLSDDAEVIVQGFSKCAKPGNFLVDTFPILRHVPSWFPGAGWKNTVNEIGRVSYGVFEKTFDEALERAQLHPESEDVATRIIQKLPSKDHPDYLYQEEVARGTTLVAYVGGSDTTVSSGQALFIALANYPETQKAAQKEIDAVVGTDRLPKASDLPNLPYVQAMIKELMRWHLVIPLAVPHVSREDDEYNGFFIPKGTVVMGNSWAILHDPETFEDPEDFKPERYLTRDPVTNELIIDTSVLDPDSTAFGYGRRICPGRHLSRESLTLMAASLLAAFNVSAPKDANGIPIKVKLKTKAGMIVKPEPFEVDIVPRSAHHAVLVAEGQV